MNEEHTIPQKIHWWIVTAIYFVIFRCGYKVRMKQRRDCKDSCEL